MSPLTPFLAFLKGMLGSTALFTLPPLELLSSEEQQHLRRWSYWCRRIRLWIATIEHYMERPDAGYKRRKDDGGVVVADDRPNDAERAVNLRRKNIITDTIIHCGV